jgi:hypothetical protein
MKEKVKAVKTNAVKLGPKKSKKKVTNIVFLLDKTGSMGSKKSDVIGGFNTFLSEQKKSKNNIKFWFTLFNSTDIEVRHDGVNINDATELTDDNYIPTGMTTLYDAIGLTLNKMKNMNNALFVIFTDGEENCSNKYTPELIKSSIKEYEDDGFKFLYLGVDLNSFNTEANTIGIRGAVNTLSSDISGSYMNMSRAATFYCKSVNDGTSDSYDALKSFNGGH